MLGPFPDKPSSRHIERRTPKTFCVQRANRIVHEFVNAAVFAPLVLIITAWRHLSLLFHQNKRLILRRNWEQLSKFIHT